MLSKLVNSQTAFSELLGSDRYLVHFKPVHNQSSDCHPEPYAKSY